MNTDELIGLVPRLGFALAVLGAIVLMARRAMRGSAVGARGSVPGAAHVPVPDVAPHPGDVASREETVVADWLLARALAETGVDLRGDAMARQRIDEAARQAVKALRTVSVATVGLPFISAGPRGPLHLNVELSADELRGLLR
jgi:hypothetical protein